MTFVVEDAHVRARSLVQIRNKKMLSLTALAYVAERRAPVLSLSRSQIPSTLTDLKLKLKLKDIAQILLMC